LVGVGAAVFRDGEVLLVKRGNPPLSDQWSLPGGLVAPGESLKEAVRREVREECAVEIEVGDLVTLFEYIERDDEGAARYHYIVFDFQAVYREGELATGSDATDSVWADVDSLDAFGVTEDVRRVVSRGAEQERAGR
jgi:ADP-ribose pyrophosphatase YjhB (NUDIX family)